MATDAATKKKDAALIAEAATKAGEIALSYFRRDIESWDKSPDNPVSEADLAVNDFLEGYLLADRPGYGCLSEETTDRPDRYKHDKIWVIDPIDGTRAFLRGGDDWGVSIALIENHQPVLAAFYAPARDVFYLAEYGKGATKNGAVIQVSGQTDINKARMMGAPEAFRSERVWPLPWPASMVIEQANSVALRLCQVADGQFDCCFTLRPKSEWDVAAVTLIVQEAGGHISNSRGEPLVFNQEMPLKARILACTPALLPDMEKRITAARKRA